MKFEKARTWFMPLGAEPLECDGKQLFYGTDGGLGSAVALDVTSVEFEEPQEAFNGLAFTKAGSVEFNWPSR
jgi:hypothetical protein